MASPPTTTVPFAKPSSLPAYEAFPYSWTGRRQSRLSLSLKSPTITTTTTTSSRLLVKFAQRHLRLVAAPPHTIYTNAIRISQCVEGSSGAGEVLICSILTRGMACTWFRIENRQRPGNGSLTNNTGDTRGAQDATARLNPPTDTALSSPSWPVKKGSLVRLAKVSCLVTRYEAALLWQDILQGSDQTDWVYADLSLFYWAGILNLHASGPRQEYGTGLTTSPQPACMYVLQAKDGRFLAGCEWGGGRGEPPPLFGGWGIPDFQMRAPGLGERVATGTAPRLRPLSSGPSWRYETTADSFGPRASEGRRLFSDLGFAGEGGSVRDAEILFEVCVQFRLGGVGRSRAPRTRVIVMSALSGVVCMYAADGLWEEGSRACQWQGSGHYKVVGHIGHGCTATQSLHGCQGGPRGPCRTATNPWVPFYVPGLRGTPGPKGKVTIDRAHDGPHHRKQPAGNVLTRSVCAYVC
ncbi:uncharacterized protein PG986_003819 [Apiospora aurea]|uniref:Uncharacterized protein n=1 Tax=Apiospora aurea TaxID=335848 RepID=A0ABR1QSQ3_9PEZI